MSVKLTKKHENGSNPLHCTHDITKQNDRAKDGEELPCSRDNGAGQRPEVHNCHEDECLEKKNVRRLIVSGHAESVNMVSLIISTVGPPTCPKALVSPKRRIL